MTRAASRVLAILCIGSMVLACYDLGVEAPVDSGMDSGSDTDTDSDSDTDTDTDTGEISPCEQVALEEPGMVCCPDEVPTDCEESTWDFTPEDMLYGCCTQDLHTMMWCWSDEVNTNDCDGGVCVFVDMWGGMLECDS